MMTTDPVSNRCYSPVPQACSRVLATMSEAGKEQDQQQETLLLRMLNSYSCQGDAQTRARVGNCGAQ